MSLEQELLEEAIRTRDYHEKDQVDLESLAKEICVITLSEIQSVLADETLDDPACFEKIEAIVQIFEAHNLSAGFRHDFG